MPKVPTNKEKMRAIMVLLLRYKIEVASDGTEMYMKKNEYVCLVNNEDLLNLENLLVVLEKVSFLRKLNVRMQMVRNRNGSHHKVVWTVILETKTHAEHKHLDKAILNCLYNLAIRKYTAYA